jgi:MFS family permease
MLLGVGIGIYSLAFFIPTILKDSGYTAVKAQLYSIPPGICGITMSLLFAFLADMYNHRFSFAIIAITLAITGFAMAGWAMSSPSARYAGLFLAYMGPLPHCKYADCQVMSPCHLCYLLGSRIIWQATLNALFPLPPSSPSLILAV